MKRKSNIVRGAAVAVVGLLAITTLMVPASAHTGSVGHLKKHMKKLFYTKGGADARFWNVGELGGTIEDKFDEPAIFSSFKNGPIDTPDTTLGTLASLSLPAGLYAINAKLYVQDAISTTEVTCDLIAGADSDRVVVTLSDVQHAVPLQVVHNFAAAGVVELKCADDQGVGDTDTKANFIKITAIRGSTLSNVASA